MKLKELKKIINDYPIEYDNLDILINGYDHSYSIINTFDIINTERSSSEKYKNQYHERTEFQPTNYNNPKNIKAILIE